MGLSSELISLFAKTTNDKPVEKKETTMYGTIVKDGDSTYVQIDGSDLLTPVSATADTVDGERVTVMIKNHTAIVTGNISSPAARTDDVKSVAGDTAQNANKITEFEIAIGHKADVSELNAANARIDELRTDNVTIKQQLTAAEADIDTLTAGNATINEHLTAAEADIDNLQANKLDANVATATYATIKSLEATDATVHNLEATYGDFSNLTANKFEAIEAEIAKLEAGEISVEQLKATFATIAQLEVEQGRITDLEAEVGDIDTLIFGSASGDVIQSSFANAVIAQLGNAQIKSAMIESITADKITSGDVITNNVRVTSEDGKLLISDETIQISDSSRVRVQIGKDSAGDYSINIWDADGNLMFSEGGITDSAIKEAIIRNDMVRDDANIAAHKLNIDSLFEEINGSSNTIKSTQIYLDDQKQTLDVAFKEVTTDVSELQNSVSSQGTEISAIQGQISSKIWQQDITSATNEIGEVTDSLSTQYNTLKQTVDGNTSTIASHTSQIATKADSSTVTTVSDKVASLESNLSGFQSTVSSTYAKKTELTDVEETTDNLSTQYNTLKQTVDGNSATIANHTSQISTKADATTVTEVSDRVTTVESNLSGFQTTVSNTYVTKTDLTDLEVGGRNLALGTSDKWTSWITPAANSLNQTHVAKYAYLSDTKEVGDKYTVSIEIEFSGVEVGTGGNFLFRAQGAVDDAWTASNVWTTGLINLTTPPEDGVYRLTATVRINDSNVDCTKFACGFRADYWNGTGKYRYRKIKVEKGGKATDWTPAPEDMATGADLTNLTNRVSTAETSINENSTAIELRATKTEVVDAIDAIAIGGRNLVRESELSADTELWNHDYTHQTISFANGYLEVSRVKDESYTIRTFGSQQRHMNPLLLPDDLSGKTYTLSADLKAIDGVGLHSGSSIFWRVNYGDGTKHEELTLSIPTTLSSTEWTRCHATRTFGTHDWTNAQVAIALQNANNGICVRNIKLEQASKPSAWTPALEDVETRIDSAETKISQNATSITAAASRISSNETAIASLELTADGLTARVNANESDISTAQSTAEAAELAAANAQSTANAAKKQLYHSTAGNSGVAGYVGICTLKVTNSYANRPILFEVTDRGQQSSNISVCFSNANSTDPALYHIQRDGGINAWIYKSDTSTWHLILQKSEGYDTFYVKDFCNNNTGVTVTWTNTHYDSLPTENIVAATLLASKIAKSVVDNAAKTATNYLNFSTDGLVVGDHTASTLKKNVLIDSDSVDIRNGTKVLASFQENNIDLGIESNEATINFCGGNVTLTAVEGTGGGYYDGVKFDSPHFRVQGNNLSFITDIPGTEESEDSRYGRFLMTTSESENSLGTTMDTVLNHGSKQYMSHIAGHTEANDDEQVAYAVVEAAYYTGVLWQQNVLKVGTAQTTLSNISSSGVIRPWNKILWSGVYYMNGSQTATLSEAVSAQPTGIVLIFSDFIDGAAVDTSFHTRFIPKQATIDHSGVGHCIQLTSSNLAYFGTKYLYVSDTKIVGHDNNIATGESVSGITRTCNHFVLRYVIGV